MVWAVEHWGVMPVRHVHGGATCVVEQGCPFERTLTPSHDQAALPLQVPKIDEVTGVRVATFRQAFDHITG